jgi:hypothetical protein
MRTDKAAANHAAQGSKTRCRETPAILQRANIQTKNGQEKDGRELESKES